ncbi:MAG: hypothetical protein AB7S75_09450 [Desulfococcaceae bacterium]
MTFDETSLHDQTIFVDANAIIYHLQGLSPVAGNVFELAEQKLVKLISTTGIIDEVIHKLLLIEARDQFGFTGKTIEKLRRDKTKIKFLAEDMNIVFSFIEHIDLQVKTITHDDLKKIPETMKSYGLLGSDSLILVMMEK